ncbi:MAG: hypothetical protein WCP24_00295 [bacterium]
MFLELLIKFNTEILPLIYKILFVLSPIFIPVILTYMAVILYVRFIQLRYIAKQKPVLLEIKIPKDIQKSPMAMEIIFAALYQNGAASYSEAYLDGKTNPWFSLELVSIEGSLHFYIWASEGKFKKIIEAQIYAQYPTVEIYEVPPEKDYARQFVYNKESNMIWGMQFGLTDKDVYPIKTYIDYNMDKDQKDEYRIDPMTAVLEYLGSVDKNQQVWFQILIKKHEKRNLKNFSLKEKADWKKEAKKEIEAIRAEATPKRDGDYPGFPNPTKGQTEKIAAIERSINKMAFDTCMRSFYMSSKSDFNPVYISGMLGSQRQYSSQYLNGFKLKAKTDVSDNYKDWCVLLPFLNKHKEYLIQKYKNNMFDAYKLRSYFFPPYQNYGNNPFVLSTEELATIYHFPGNVSATPTLAKIASKKSGPPVNLPIKK